MSDAVSDPGSFLLRGGYIFALFSAVCYGSITTFATLAYGAGLEVEHLVISRGFIVAAICVGLAFASGQSLSVRRVNPLRLGLLGLAFVATAFFQLGAVQYISVGMTVILFFTFPIFVTFLDIVAGRVQPGPQLFIAPLIALVGITVAIGPDSVSGTLHMLGIVLALLAAMAMAASIVIAQGCMANGSVPALGFAGNLLASLFGLVLWSASGQAHLPQFQPGQTALALAMLCAVGCLFGAGILFQFESIRRVGSIPTSMTLNFEPVVTLVVAAVLIGEALTGAKLAGAALIVLSVILSSRTHRIPTNTRNAT